MSVIFSDTAYDLPQNLPEMTRDDLLEFIEIQYGKYLARLFIDHWRIAAIEEANTEFENEHAKSLALLFEIESQKLIMDELNNKLTEAAEIQMKDMRMAAQVQRNLLFKTPPVVNDYEIAFYYEPYASVSGDFYDFYTPLSDSSRLSGIVLADVSGHGISSSLLTVLSKPVFYRIFNKNKDKPLNYVLETINDNIIREIHESGNYLTCILLRINGGAVEYINAAHPDIIIKRAHTGLTEFGFSSGEQQQGAMLGLSDIKLYGTPVTFVLDRGDFLIVYTDCLIESKNRNDVEFGENRLAETVRELPSALTPDEMCMHLVSALKAHIGRLPLNDDLSVIVLKKV